jgi:hypothetical protein
VAKKELVTIVFLIVFLFSFTLRGNTTCLLARGSFQGRISFNNYFFYSIIYDILALFFIIIFLLFFMFWALFEIL